MDGQNDFFTWQSLATFAGTTTATTAIVNGVQKVWPKLGSAAALGLGVSLVLCVVAAVINPATGEILFARPFATYLIAIINGFFVFASAAGLSAGGAAVVHGDTAKWCDISRGWGRATSHDSRSTVLEKLVLEPAHAKGRRSAIFGNNACSCCRRQFLCRLWIA